MQESVVEILHLNTVCDDKAK